MTEPLQNTDIPRNGGLLPSQGIEWSQIWLAVGLLGMLFLVVLVIGNRSHNQPTYDRNLQITPSQLPESPTLADEPEIGSSDDAKSNGSL